MQDYSQIYVPSMVLTNTGITPRSHNLKQLKNAPMKFSQRVYSCQKQNATLIYSWCRGVFYKRDVGFTWRVSCCEELVARPE